MVFNSLNRYYIYNDYNYPVKKELSVMRRYINKCLKEEKVKNATFNIILVDNKTIRNLNKSYRKIDK